MIKLLNPKAQAAVEAALRSENPASYQDFELVVDGTDRTTDLADGAVDAGEGPAIVFDPSLEGALPKGLEGKEVTVSCVVAGHPVRRFTGKVWKQGSPAFRTNLLCRSAGFWLSEVKLQQRYEPSGYRPQTVAYDVLNLAPYDSGLVRVDPIPGPSFTRAVDDAFLMTASVADVLASLAKEAPIAPRDRASGGHHCQVDDPLPTAETVWDFVVGRDLREEDFSADREADPYYDVAAVRQTDAGPVEIGGTRQKVPGSSAPKGATLFLEVSDGGPTSAADARQAVHDAVFGLWRGRWRVGAHLEWVHALLERGDTVGFTRVRSYAGGLREEERFRVRLSGVKDLYPAMQMDLSGTGVLTTHPLPPEPREAVPSPGSLLRPAFGFDSSGRFYLSGTLRWARLDERSGVVLSPGAAIAGAPPVRVALVPERGVLIDA
jgi:hypothetical protein